jgi:adenylate cyclase
MERIDQQSSRPSGAELAVTMRRGLFRTGMLANGGGALIAFAFLAFLLPAGPAGEDGRLLPNAAVFVVYLPLTLVLGSRWARRRQVPVDRWLRSGRAAGSEERACVLRQPLDQAMISFVFWAIAALLFTTLNVVADLSLAVSAGVGALLAGLTSATLNYLAAERVLRPVTARALEGAAPPERLVLGVRGRLTIAWALGSGVTMLAIAGIALIGLLDETFERPTLAAAALFLVVVGLGTGLLLTRLAARSVADPLTAVRSALADVERGRFDVEVPVDDGSEIGFLEAGFNRMASGLGERERLREAFGTFVDPELTDRVLREGTDLAGEEVELSVLFMDVRGFTSYAEGASARDVVATLNELYDDVVPLIAEHGGHANKFVGDGLLAVFGAPRRLSGHADCAVSAALALAKLVRERHGHKIGVGVGVNSGVVVAGTVGGGGRLEFTVIGDVVNTAARVEAATRETGDDVLITEATLALLSDGDGGWEERPPMELKGKSREVRLYAPAAPLPVG